uniref:ABC transmembrane type-1 domain-containing protein n=1 Tax=Panagrolaimus sp. PS1159 TaxID=55785 RepID=A0AC35FPX6_9BILA
MCLIGLYSVIEKNVFYGIATICFFLPFNFFTFKVFTKIQKKQMQTKDARLKMITDILSGIKILKLYAWEIPMGKMIMKNRQAEVSLQKRMHFCTTLTSIAFNAYPIVATIVCLIGYIIFDGKQLTPEIAFLTLLFFNLMRSSIYAIPQLTQQMIKAKISFDRIQKFLLEDEVPEIKNTMDPSNKDTIVELYNSTFSWSHEDFEASIPVLKSLTLEIKEGELIGII